MKEGPTNAFRAFEARTTVSIKFLEAKLQRERYE